MTTDPRHRIRLIAHHVNRAIAFSQLMFGATLLAVFSMALLFGGSWPYPELSYGGLVVTFISCAMAVLVPWNQVSRYWVMALPLVDIFVIAAFRSAHPELGFGLLWVFPVIWMARSFSRLGALVSIGAVWSCIWLELLWRETPPPVGTVPTLLTLSLVLAFVATSSYFPARRSAAQRVLLRKQATLLEGSLAETQSSTELLTEVLDTVDFGVIRIAPSGKITFINQAQTRMPLSLGTSGGQTDPPVHLTDEKGNLLQPADSPLERALRGEDFSAVTFWTGEKGEDRVAYQVTARHLQDRSGQFDGSVVVTRNVTTELKAVSARDDLIASVSHELRTPLTSIVGYLELALDGGQLSPATEAQLRVAYRNSNRLLELVAEILSTSRDGVRPSPLHLAECDLLDVIGQSVEALEPGARERGIRVELRDSDPLTITADASRLRQVVDNLLSNAIKYNVDHGAVIIGLDSDEQAVTVSMRDTGIGIPDSEQPRLFDRYFRSERVRNSTVHGSGLGLCISREIVRRHGGELTMSSIVGVGTTAQFSVPRNRPKPDAERQHPHLSPPEETHAV